MIRQIILVTILIFKCQIFYCQEENQIKIDTLKYNSRDCEDCPIIQKVVIYKLLECGLYKGSNGDLALKSELLRSDFESERTYVKTIWGVKKNDSIGGGRVEFKDIIDVQSFKFLNYSYWSDKNNIYYFFANSDGGSVSLVDNVDLKSFQVLENTRYAKDKFNVYYGGNIIDKADSKTFKLIKKGAPHGEFGYDKTNFYESERRLTKAEIKEYNLKRE